MRTFSRVFLFVAALVLAYFYSYVLMVGRAGGDCQSGVWAAQVEYRFDSATDSSGAARFYRLAHILDRRILRPSLWSGTCDPVALIAAELAIQERTTQN